MRTHNFFLNRKITLDLLTLMVKIFPFNPDCALGVGRTNAQFVGLKGRHPG